eukprot:TRINITY_DN8127_c0_g1_i1.p1 TRINITY_DN8127_c0_g1~~TRINITY_DN8127_c0_g1_i1.p1  ORF type:complete len:819 (-),score=118.60 TRINITY_DN8127_c0_g1_i1:3-2459(-)
MYRQLLTIFLVSIFTLYPLVKAFTEEELKELRDEVKEMFYHAYDSYMTYAFPYDELKPLSCEGRRRDTSNRGHLDDILGDFSLTLIDSMDTLVVMNDSVKFNEAIRLILDHVSFDKDVTVSLFETNIRVLGGLLSAHVQALTHVPGYDNQLLEMAIDLGHRLLPAFDTPTGIPVSRINLRHGIPKGETSDTCTACAGTLLLELGILSRLSGISIFEETAKRAVSALWNRRSDLGLFGNVINTNTGLWIYSDSGIGAGIDSFYEYLLKCYLYFGDQEYFNMFNETYRDVRRFINKDNWYMQVDMNSGAMRYTWIDSLSAFWPGLQVSIGDLSSAMAAHDKYFQIWKYYGVIPERYDIVKRYPLIKNYPLRPEFIESTYFLYRATGNHYYLEVGKQALRSIQKCCRVDCGYASIANVETLRLEDRMDSFFLTETCKYLYLLFDRDNFIHKGNYIFTTEGHFFPFNQWWHASSFMSLTNESCQFFEPRKAMVRSLFGSKNSWNIENPVSLKDSHDYCFLKDKPKPVVEFILNGIEKSTISNIAVHFVPKDFEAVVSFSYEDRTLKLYAMKATFGPSFYVQPEDSDKSTVSNETSRIEILRGNLILSDPQNACDPLNNKDAANGQIVLISRGSCMFLEKVQQAQNAGAIGAIIINTKDEELFPMNGSPDKSVNSLIQIKSVMVNKRDGEFLIDLVQKLGSFPIEIYPKYSIQTGQNNFQIVLKTNQFLNQMPNVHPDSDIYVSGSTVFLNNVDPNPELVDWGNSIINLLFDDVESPIRIQKKNAGILLNTPVFRSQTKNDDSTCMDELIITDDFFSRVPRVP